MLALVQDPLTEERRRAALALVERAFGERPAIVGEEAAGHAWAPVTRLTLDRELPLTGNSVIIKIRHFEGEGHGGSVNLRREHAGLCLAASANLAPHVIGFDGAAGVLAVTDLGRWPTLEEMLLGDDAGAAACAMLELGRTVGRLHAATLLVAQHPTSAAATCDLPLASVIDWAPLEAVCDEHGFPDARVARDDVAALRERLIAPAPFAALVHADLTPSNALITPDGVKLVDFEWASRGHPGFDAAFLHYPFPTYSAHWATLPDDVLRDAGLAYRAALAPALPPGAADELDGMLAFGAAAVLVLRVHRLAKLVAPDQPPHERWRRRSQLIQQIRAFERVAAHALPALAGWFTDLASAMAERWVEASTPPPRFPAFRFGSG
jgi:hypothetical protein